MKELYVWTFLRRLYWLCFCFRVFRYVFRYHLTKMFSIKNFFSNCDQIRSPADLVTFTEENLNGKLHFLCSVLPAVHYLPKKIKFLLVSILACSNFLNSRYFSMVAALLLKMVSQYF